ncbi:MAG: hypothetical protein MRERV_1c112 [Mycoplasmataceae bacterium RV_VA103A]|nr:MAG: hypothetical protein MRERV_1c112 [Mycoplasmataceae bacterium RV_VA103A]
MTKITTENETGREKDDIFKAKNRWFLRHNFILIV